MLCKADHSNLTTFINESYIVTYQGFLGKLINEFVLICWILIKLGILIVPINIIMHTEVYFQVLYNSIQNI